MTPADWDNLADLALGVGCGLLLSFAATAFATHLARLRGRHADRCALTNCRKAAGTDGLVSVLDGEGGTQLVCRDHVVSIDLDRHAEQAIAIASGHREAS